MTTIQLTETQQDALDFYGEVHNYVEAFGLTNLQREERLLYKKGRQLLEEAMKKRSPSKLEHYTQDERTFIAVAYVQGLDRRTIVNKFRQQFGDNHTADSIGQKVEMCKSIDSTHKNHKRFQFRDNELLIILQDLDPNRFEVWITMKDTSVSFFYAYWMLHSITNWQVFWGFMV